MRRTGDCLTAQTGCWRRVSRRRGGRRGRMVQAWASGPVTSMLRCVSSSQLECGDNGFRWRRDTEGLVAIMLVVDSGGAGGYGGSGMDGRRRRAMVTARAGGIHQGRLGPSVQLLAVLFRAGVSGIRGRWNQCVPNSGRGPQRRLRFRWLRICRALPFGGGAEARLLAMCGAHS